MTIAKRQITAASRAKPARIGPDVYASFRSKVAAIDWTRVHIDGDKGVRK